MHAGTCQVEGRVAGGGRGGGGALALWPGAHVLRERSPHPSSHHVLCVIVWCRLDLLHAPKSYRSPRASSSGVCDTALERSFSRRPRPRVTPPPPPPPTPRRPYTHGRGGRRARGGAPARGPGGAFKPGPRTCRVARRPLSAVARYVHKTSETSQWIIYTQLKQKTRCT
jgi:hypothetical protein